MHFLSRNIDLRQQTDFLGPFDNSSPDDRAARKVFRSPMTEMYEVAANDISASAMRTKRSVIGRALQGGLLIQHDLYRIGGRKVGMTHLVSEAATEGPHLGFA